MKKAVSPSSNKKITQAHATDATRIARMGPAYSSLNGGASRRNTEAATMHAAILDISPNASGQF